MEMKPGSGTAGKPEHGEGYMEIAPLSAVRTRTSSMSATTGEGYMEMDPQAMKDASRPPTQNAYMEMAPPFQRPLNGAPEGSEGFMEMPASTQKTSTGSAGYNECYMEVGPLRPRYLVHPVETVLGAWRWASVSQVF